jgi:hypothetical protein
MAQFLIFVYTLIIFLSLFLVEAEHRMPFFTPSYTLIFFFEDIKMRYINTGDVCFSVQDGPKRPSQKAKSHTQYIQKTGQLIPKQDRGPTTIYANHTQTWHY